MKSEMFEPLPYSPPLAPSNNGPYFEMRSYVLKPGGTPRWRSAGASTCLAASSCRR